MSPVIQGIADTARWVAIYRALESERPDAVFRDPYARRLGGERGAEIMASMPATAQRAGWVFVARTFLFDHFIQGRISDGVTLVVNLAAGLDTRPYRLPVPASLKWIEVDQPALLAEKATLLADARPGCALERVPLDLADEGARREFLQDIGKASGRVLIITEGLLIYLSEAQVGRLAADLAAEAKAECWVTDLTSPALLRIIQNDWGRTLRDGGAPLQFSPEAGPGFFAAHGWHPGEVRSTLLTAARLKRLPLFLRLIASLPWAGAYHPRRPWSGVCLLTRKATTA